MSLTFLFLPFLGLSALPTVTYHYSTTCTSAPGNDDPICYPTKIWERSSPPPESSGSALPRLFDLPTGYSAFILLGIPFLAVAIVGTIYQIFFWNYETVSNPKYVDPTLFLGTGADALVKARRTIQRRRSSVDRSEDIE